MKNAIALLFGFLLVSTPIFAGDTIYDFTAKSIDGADVAMKDYSGKVLLIVNVASQCGVTDQYVVMQAMYEVLKDSGFVVMGFPSNDFGAQEPGSDGEIKAFCETNYGVTFPMFAKTSVSGDAQTPLFRFLTESENPDGAGPIGWNFEKILVGKDGKVARRFKSFHEPDDPALIKAIKKALAAG
ncbi:MAG: glutathione peroxidase [Verrucomicrobiota bacterium]